MPKYLKVTNLTHAIRQIWPCTSGKQASEKNGRICFLLFLGAWRFKRGNWVWSDVELPLDLFSLLSERSWLLKLTLINLNSCYLPTIPFWSNLVQPCPTPITFSPILKVPSWGRSFTGRVYGPPPVQTYGPPVDLRGTTLRQGCCHHLGPPGNAYHEGSHVDRGAIMRRSMELKELKSDVVYIYSQMGDDGGISQFISRGPHDVGWFVFCGFNSDVFVL